MKYRLILALTLSAMILAACGAAEPEPAPAPPEPAPEAEPLPEGNGTRENPYVGRGFVEEVGEGQLLINHETIPGWMPGMRMAFPVTEEVDLSGVSVGDRIIFDIEMAGEAGYRVFHIEPVE